MREFTDAIMLFIKPNKTFTYYHVKNPNDKILKFKNGSKYHLDIMKAYQLHGWVPWVAWSWWRPWSIIEEWAWKIDHRTALLIYRENLDNKSGVNEPITAFDNQETDFSEITPRGFEGFLESRIPVNYFKKWTTGKSKIAWWVWLLLIFLIIFLIYYVNAVG